MKRRQVARPAPLPLGKETAHVACSLPPPPPPPVWWSRPPRLGGETALPTAGFTLHRALHDGRPGFPGADGRLPIRSRCGRVYD